MTFGVNAWCRLEDLTGRTSVDVIDELRGEQASMRTLRQFVKATLVDPKDASLDEVGDIIDDLGGPAIIRGMFSVTPAVQAAPEKELVPA